MKTKRRRRARRRKDESVVGTFTLVPEVGRGRVTQVAYRSSIELDRFRHAHVELTATVGDGETTEQVLAGLKLKVGEELVRVKNEYAQAKALTGSRY